MGSPRFSFIVPTHGRPGLLTEALASIRQQTVSDWECVVVDDASPVPAVVPDDARFRLIRRDESGGPGAARNTGLEAAQGEVIVFLDDDDLVTPDRLEIVEEGLHMAPVGLCWGGVVGRPDKVRDQSWHGDVSRTILCAVTPHLGQTAVVRDETLLFDDRYLGAEDVEWWLRLASSAPVVTVPRVGWLWRRHDGERGLSDSRARVEGRRLLLSAYSDYFRDHAAAEAFQLKRLGLQLVELGERHQAARVLVRSMRLKPSIRTASNFLRLALERS